MILTLLRTLGYFLFALLMKRMLTNSSETTGIIAAFTPMSTEEYVKRHGHKRPF